MQSKFSIKKHLYLQVDIIEYTLATQIYRLWRETYREFDMKDDEKKQILQEIKILEWTKEEAIASAALGGKMWNTLGPKENIKQQIKVIRYCHELSVRFS